MNINIYQNVKEIKSEAHIPLDLFLENIKDGVYWEHVQRVQTAKTNEDKKISKQKAALVTISGTFKKRVDSDIIEHSGFICIDVDNVDVDKTKIKLSGDPYIYSMFKSISGKGLAIIFSIDGKRHKDAFYSITEYLNDTYGIVSDPSCINVSRARFVSHDPDIIINKKANKWNKYIPKKEIEKKTETKIVFVKNDFESIIQQIYDKRIDLGGSYHNWLCIGFGLHSHFGDDGLRYWQIISQFRNGDKAKNDQLINRQWEAIKKSDGKKSGRTIATFYYFAKQHNIETYSQVTKEIIRVTGSKMRGGMKHEDVIEDLLKQTDFDKDLVNEIVPQVREENSVEDITLIDLVVDDLNNNFNIRKNVITRQLEIYKSGKWSNLDKYIMNTLYLNFKKNHEKLTFELFSRILISDFVEEFNPFLSFIEKNKDRKPQDAIKKLSSCFHSDFGLSGTQREFYLKKWILGIVSAMHGEHSPLMLVLTGEKQGTGKTEFFRRLLPDDLKSYYAESKLDNGKDDEILMTKKLIIMDDEMAGKSKRETAKLKSITSKQEFSIRVPYGEFHEDLPRIAVLCATSNEVDILNDPTGNRRIIPIHVSSFNYLAYNDIDKTDLLIEAYNFYCEGERHHLTKTEIEDLKKINNDDFDESVPEKELFFKYFEINKGTYHTTSEIIAIIYNITGTRLSIRRMGQELKKLGIERKTFKRNNIAFKGYMVNRCDMNANEEIESFEVPF